MSPLWCASSSRKRTGDCQPRRVETAVGCGSLAIFIFDDIFFHSHSSGRKLIDGLRCIDNFTGRCLDAQHREFFHMLYAGTKQVIVDLCQDEDYQAGNLVPVSNHRRSAGSCASTSAPAESDLSSFLFFFFAFWNRCCWNPKVAQVLYNGSPEIR